MKIADYYQGQAPSISFELFPPRNEVGMRALQNRLPKLISLEPEFITVTYGAMGQTQEKTLEIASMIRNEYGIDTAHHLTCIGTSKTTLGEILDSIHSHGIDKIVALRGDPPSGESLYVPPANTHPYASDLVHAIRNDGRFSIAVAGYPETHTEAPDPETDLRHLRSKVNSGADAIITQLYYDNDAFYSFVNKCRAIGITQPIVPGLMPILDVQQIKRITRICGATIPAILLRNLELADGNPDKVHEIGIQHTVQQALDLLSHGVPGIHFYVLNQYFHIAEIMNRIRHALPQTQLP